MKNVTVNFPDKFKLKNRQKMMSSAKEYYLFRLNMKKILFIEILNDRNYLNKYLTH